MLVKIDNEYLHLELNSNDQVYYHVRNFIYFTNIFSRKVKRKEEYDISTKFIHIDLTYGMSKKKPLESHFFVQDKHGNKYINNFEIIVYNMDRYMEFWYNNDKENIEKYKHLIMLNLEKEDLNRIKVGDEFIMKYDNEIETLNETYIPAMTPEEDFKMIVNSEKHISYDEGYKEGIEQGIEQGNNIKSKEITKKLLDKGFSIEEIAEITGLAIDEISKM